MFMHLFINTFYVHSIVLDPTEEERFFQKLGV